MKRRIQRHLTRRDRSIEPSELRPSIQQINRMQPRLDNPLEHRSRERKIIPRHHVNLVSIVSNIIPKDSRSHPVRRRNELEQQRADQRVNIQPLIRNDVNRSNRIDPHKRRLIPARPINIQRLNNLTSPSILRNKPAPPSLIHRHAQQLGISTPRPLRPVISQRVEHHVIIVAGRPPSLPQEVRADPHVLLRGDPREPDRHARLGALKLERQRVNILDLSPGGQLDGREQEPVIQILLQDRTGSGILRVVVRVEKIDHLLRGATLQHHDLERADDRLEHHVGPGVAASVKLG
ncbi:hypothetical protein ENSA7_78800 [Enhygromyxa salina]|uniref:Uncharacterized protein n=1 Tax=Enhygromyxa salina TaxID=215803 RepID=A0A2S9XNA9_9BACT|nr:hypothetical protein ENSA7_78800 [Enhygromyxa salina]